TDDLCSGGTPTHPPTTAGSPCTMGGTVCDGSGHCVACNVKEDCGTDGTCGTFKCFGQHMCGGTFAQSGKLCTESGGKVCDGNGNCVGCLTNAQCTAPETCGGGGVVNKCGCGQATCAALGKTCGMIC